MASTVDTVISSYGSGFGFLLKNLSGTFTDFLKIYLLSFVLSIGFGAVMIGILIGGAGLAASNIIILILLGVVLMGFYILLQTVVTSITNVGFCAIHDRMRKKRVAVIDRAKQLFSPVAKYIIVVTLIQLVTVLPILVMTTLLPVGTMVLGLLIVFGLAWLVFIYFIQFALPEIAIGNRDGFEAIRRSVGMVRSNLAGVLLFDIVLVILLLVVLIAFTIVNQLISGMLIIGGSSNIAIMLVALVLLVVLTILQNIVLGMVMMSTQYSYWKALGGQAAY